MTYREKYKQLHPEEDASEVHLDLCAKDSAGNGLRCPFAADINEINAPDYCRDCWDSEIPGTEAVPSKSEPASTPEKAEDGKVTARILVESDGDTIHTEVEGDPYDSALCALAAVHMTAKEIYDSAEDKLAAEKLIHDMQQKALSPTGKIWGFDDK